jgi:hypothetical protein
MRYIQLLIVALITFVASAQEAADKLLYFDEFGYPVFASDTISVVEPEPVDTVIVMKPLTTTMFIPAVYNHYEYFDGFNPFESEYSDNEAFKWIDEANAVSRREAMLRQRYMLKNPGSVRYNTATMRHAPKEYYAEVNPREHTIKMVATDRVTPDKIVLDEGTKRHWLRTFNASLQFSQAYVSPNWYQGGNNNLNMLANINYNVKLNQVYHPNLLFETTFQYKLGLNSAPDDSLRNISISEDLLQINSTFGVKAAHRWYYSITAQFKTQILNSYTKNTYNLSSAFMAPGELNAGLGMTYNYANKKSTFTFDASLAPLSYNIKTCLKPNDVLSHENFNVDADRDYAMTFGSTAECKMVWKMTSNIQFTSRLYVFSDYSYIYGDWENTLNMDINQYLSTQIYVHARYDSTTPRTDDPSWHKLQLKEILSFGVAYKFSSI